VLKKSKAPLILSALLASAALLGSCQFSLQLWVVPGSTAENLVLGFAESRRDEEKVRPHSVQVFPCAAVKKPAGELTSEAEALWQATVPPGVEAPAVNRLTYGRDEHGLRTTRGPAPLAAGCYAVVAYARDARDDLRAAALRIEVAKDGRVTAK
jgi:hypothetical protein